MKICKLFDKYRDKELEEADRSRFEAHLAACDECRTKMTRIDNLVYVLNQDAVPQVDLSQQIARKAFEEGRSWDFLVVSWLRPGTALATLALMFVLFSFAWLAPNLRRVVNTNSEYEKLMEEADAASIGSRVSELRSDSDLVIWLQEEGNSR